MNNIRMVWLLVAVVELGHELTLLFLAALACFVVVSAFDNVVIPTY